MPEAVIGAIGSLIFGGKVGEFFITATLSTAASYAVAKNLAKKAEGLNGNSINGGSKFDPSRDIMQARRVIWGRDRVGGTVRFRHRTGTNGEYLYYIIVWAGHECDAIEEFRFGDEVISFDGSGNAIGTYAGFIRCTHHLGAWDQAADANFVSELSGIWTTNHRGRGCCYSALRFKWDQDKFPAGLQLLTGTIRGRKIWDPRDEDQDPDDPTTWLWSANAALCRADYMRGVPFLNGAGQMVRKLGLRLSDDRLNLGVLIASANACDEQVALAVGGYENRYEANGSVDCDSDHPSVIAALESADGGRTLFTGGGVDIRSGYWNAPDFDVTESMIRRGQRRTRTPLSRREKFNLVNVSFTNPDAGYQRTAAPAVYSSTFISADGGELPRNLDLPFTASSTMAQRIARQIMLRSRQGIIYQQPCNLKALPALTGENIRISRSRLGWTNKHFELIELDLTMERGDRGGLGIALDITAQETASSIFDWNSSLEQSVDPAPNTTLGYFPPQVGADGISSAPIFIYQRAAAAPSLPSGATVYTFATGVLTGLDNGWSQTIPTGTDPIYISLATAAAIGATDTIAAAEWASPQIMAQDGAPGAAGAKTATVSIYKRSATAPALPTAQTTYTFATATLAGLDNGWSQAIPGGTDPLYAALATAFGTGATDTIEANEWTTPVIMAQDGASGASGESVYIEYSIDGSTSWHSTYATGDLYMRQRLGLGGAWSGAMPVIGPLSLLPDPSNLCFNPIFDLGNVGWLIWAGSGFPDGEFEITDTAGELKWGAHLLQTDASPHAMRNHLGVACRAGDRFFYRVHVKGATMYGRITFYDQDDTEIFYAATPVAGGSSWVNREIYVVAPLGSIWCRAEIVGDNNDCYVDQALLNRITPNVVLNDPATSVPPPNFATAGGYITLAAVDPSSTVKYTLNGGATQTYSAPIAVSAGDVVQSWAERSGYTASTNTRVLQP